MEFHFNKKKIVFFTSLKRNSSSDTTQMDVYGMSQVKLTFDENYAAYIYAYSFKFVSSSTFTLAVTFKLLVD